jgi:hypothetical protein
MLAKRSSVVAMAACALACASVAAQTALGCECGGDSVAEILAPQSDATTDATPTIVVHVQVGSFFDPAPTLVFKNSTGLPIDLVVDTVALIDRHFVLIGRATTALAEETHEISVLVGEEVIATSTFTVDASSPAEGAASVPVINGVDRIVFDFQRDDCGDAKLAYSLDVTAADALVLLQDVKLQADDLDPLSSEGLVLGLTAGGGASCGPFGWPEAALSAQVQTRVLAIGADGVPSPWSEPFTVVTPADSDCDGVDDARDVCPDEAGGIVADGGGCPDDGASLWVCADDPTSACAPDGRVCIGVVASPTPAEGEGEGEDVSDAREPSCGGAPVDAPALLLALFAGRRSRQFLRSSNG